MRDNEKNKSADLDTLIKKITLADTLNAFVVFFTSIIAFSSLLSYCAMKNDFRDRTRPYIGIDFKGGKDRVYLHNYGQVPAYNVRLVQHNSCDEAWTPFGGISSAVIMPTEDLILHYDESKCDQSNSTEKRAFSELIYDVRSKARERVPKRIRFISQYGNADRELIYSTTLYYTINYRSLQSDGKPTYYRQEEYAN